jgi:hypothetical protein
MRRTTDLLVVAVSIAAVGLVGGVVRHLRDASPPPPDVGGIVWATTPPTDSTIGAVMTAPGNGGRATLVGARVPAVVDRGTDLAIGIAFDVDAVFDSDWTVFVHVEQDTFRLNLDHAPGLGRHPTTAWQAGQHIWDTSSKRIPVETPVGRYDVWAGLYRGETRVLVSGPVRTDGNHRVWLGTVNVQ